MKYGLVDPNLSQVRWNEPNNHPITHTIVEVSDQPFTGFQPPLYMIEAGDEIEPMTWYWNGFMALPMPHQ